MLWVWWPAGASGVGLRSESLLNLAEWVDAEGSPRTRMTPDC